MSDRIGLIFDLDGTLIDSAPEIHAAVLRVLADEGLPPLDYARLLGFVGNGVSVLVARILADLGRDPSGEMHQRMCKSLINIYEQSFDLTTLYPGVPELLQLAARNHPLAICTNKPERPTRAILAHFGLLTHFKVIIGGDTLPQRKPDPAPLLLAAKALGTPRNLFVGDSEVDTETAVAAGMPFALYSGGYRKTAPEAFDAKVIFDHHTALPGLLAHAFRP